MANRVARRTEPALTQQPPASAHAVLVTPSTAKRATRTDRVQAAAHADNVANADSLILGIDPGLDRTGYAVIDPARRSVLDAGVIRAPADRPLARRLYEISQGIESVLDEHRVRLIAVEDLYAHYKHPRTAILMGHARGVVLLAAARHDVEVLSLPATQIKKTITGSGRASKAQIQRAVMIMFRLSKIPEPADVADALAAAACVSELRTAIRA